MKIKFLLFSSMLMMLGSCADSAKEATNWTDVGRNETVPGKYHFLESDGTKIFLPDTFERYSISEMQQVLDSLMDNKTYEYEVDRLNKLKDARGDFYIYYDESSGATCLINTVEYMPISKDDAQLLVGYMRMNSEKSPGMKDINLEKITAVYSGEPTKYIFKAVYRLTEPASEDEWYNAGYMVTSNLKTVYIQLVTGFEVDFDPYITKTIL